MVVPDRIVVTEPSPGRVANIHTVPYPRPRSLGIMATKDVFDLLNRIKLDIVGDRQRQGKNAQETKALAVTP